MPVADCGGMACGAPIRASRRISLGCVDMALGISTSGFARAARVRLEINRSSGFSLFKLFGQRLQRGDCGFEGGTVPKDHVAAKVCVVIREI